MNEMLTGTQDRLVKDTTMSVKQVDWWMVGGDARGDREG
jgi:hypothetical protein